MTSEIAVRAPHDTARAAPHDVYVYRPKSLMDVRELAATMVKGGFAPKGSTVESAMCALMAGSEVGFTPFQAIQNIIIISGKPSMYVNAMLALIEASGMLESHRYEYEGEGAALRCRAIVRRVGRKDDVTGEFSVKEAQQAGLSGDGWKKYPKRMVKHRALGWALQDAFPDVIRGMRTVEEMRDVDPRIEELKRGTVVDGSKAALLNLREEAPANKESPDVIGETLQRIEDLPNMAAFERLKEEMRLRGDEFHMDAKVWIRDAFRDRALVLRAKETALKAEVLREDIASVSPDGDSTTEVEFEGPTFGDKHHQREPGEEG